MTARKDAITVVLLVFFTTTTISAQQQAHSLSDGRLPALEEQLERHHIGLTRTGLTEALHDTDAEVRYLAALKLAEDGERDTIPALVEALLSETVPTAQVNIAFALAQLGDTRGVSKLRSTCQGAAAPIMFRITAVEYLLDLHNESCLGLVLELLRSDDQQRRVQALALIQRFQHIPKEDLPKVVKVIVPNLLDSTAAARSYASRALASIGDSSALPYLQSAASRERDQLVRAGMEKDLKKLQQKQVEP